MGNLISLVVIPPVRSLSFFAARVSAFEAKDLTLREFTEDYRVSKSLRHDSDRESAHSENPSLL
ncbi:MAG: hypothetical protein ACR2G6_14785 [Gemmatimonadaceae bacterium]